MAEELDIKRLQELAGIVGSQRELVDASSALTIQQIAAARLIVRDAAPKFTPGSDDQILAVAQMIATNMAAAALVAKAK